MSGKSVLLRDFIVKSPQFLKTLVKKNEEILCKQVATGKQKTMPAKVLYEHDAQFWDRQESSWQYFINADTAASILETCTPETPIPAIDSNAEKVESPKITKSTNPFSKSSQKERDQALKDTLNALDNSQTPIHRSLDQTLEAGKTTTLVNSASLAQSLEMDDHQARLATREMVSLTSQIVKSVSSRASANPQEIMQEFSKYSDGTVVGHMTRTFMKALSFLYFYNDQLKSRGLVNRIRLQFPKKYRPLYKRLLYYVDESQLTLEKVFLGGMRYYQEGEIARLSTGFLLHDLGKLDDLDYHEGSMPYDRDRVVRHIALGWDALTKKTLYPIETGMIAGFHHEYNNDYSGYGFFRDGLATHLAAKPEHKVEYGISFDAVAMGSFKAWGFFPAKILEIVDVFDALTDKKRKYKKPASEEEALVIMREEFVDKALKIDPILFDIFRLQLGYEVEGL